MFSWLEVTVGVGAGVAAVAWLYYTYPSLDKPTGPAGTLSIRGRRAFSGRLYFRDRRSSAPSYVIEHINRLGDPDYTCLSIAENKLSYKLLQPTVSKALHEVAAATDSCASQCGGSLGYTDPAGSPGLRAVLADFLAREVAGNRCSGAINPESIVCSAGLAATTHMILMALCDVGDQVLIPAPSYSGFDGTVRDHRVFAVPVQSSKPGAKWDDIDSNISVEALENAQRRDYTHTASESLIHTSVLLLSSPSNPTGQLYSAAALKRAVQWAQSHGIHTVIDEVYAGSVHQEGENHCSALELFESDESGLVHTLYGFAKDFGMAGWRVGVLHSKNTALISAVRTMAHQCEASTLTQSVIERVLRDTHAVSTYLDEHRKTMRTACIAVSDALRRARIPFITPSAGVFVFIDLRGYLTSPTFEDETKLYHELLDRAKVNLTPGGAMNCGEPGYFRICFAYNALDETVRAVERVISVLESRHRKTVK